MDNLTEKRMAKEQVRKLLTHLLKSGSDIQFTEYAEKRMQERGITTSTVLNVLERGRVNDAEKYTYDGWNQWRYRVETDRYRVVITFQVKNEVLIINAIDFKPHLAGNVVQFKKGDK